MKHFYPVTATQNILPRFKKCILFVAACFLLQFASAQVVPGNAHSFNGINQYDSVYRFVSGNNISYEYTVEAWVNQAVRLRKGASSTIMVAAVGPGVATAVVATAAVLAVAALLEVMAAATVVVLMAVVQ